MANKVYIATSLDGYIAGPNGELDWLMSVPAEEGNDYGFAAFMETVDALIMGRNTYEQVLSFGQWPYNKKVFVLSNSLDSVSDDMKDKAEVVKGELQDVLKTLNERGYHNLYIDGGKTIQSFLKEDLIDEMIITKITKLIGDGIPLFSKSDQEFGFKVVKTEILNEFMVKTYFVRA